MTRVLLAWIGGTDLRASTGDGRVGVGPIAQALASREFDEVHLLGNYPEEECTAYIRWVRARSDASISFRWVRLTSPTDYAEIHRAAVDACEAVLKGREGKVSLTMHLSPGTPAMQAIWLILGKTRFPAELLQTSREEGVKTASVPFEIAAEYLPESLQVADEQLRYGAAAEPPPAPGFEDILHRSPQMIRVVDLARRVARRDVPVLIQGESGTGKELFARAIHRTSPRAESKFHAINCGAIPENLVESELFGHTRNAFTGADKERAGHFEATDGGTLFLDEIGELPLQAQVRLLRVLQEGEVLRIGATTAKKIDVRVIAATNRSLSSEVAASRFREDLFYRLAVGVIELPPLRERSGDLGLLLDRFFEDVNHRSARDPDYQPKTMSAGARQVLLSHDWPGNVRELINTLHRLVIFSPGAVIERDDARWSLLPRIHRSGGNPWDRPIVEGFSLPALLEEIEGDYLQRAYEKAGHNKTRAAKLVGLSSQQTFTNRMKKCAVRSSGE